MSEFNKRKYWKNRLMDRWYSFKMNQSKPMLKDVIDIFDHQDWQKEELKKIIETISKEFDNLERLIMAQKTL